MNDELAILESLGKRFHGADLQYRRSGTDWPNPWRARIQTTKNEREEYRLSAFGAYPKEAILLLQVMVNKL
jgi:hypothetical protein